MTFEEFQIETARTDKVLPYPMNHVHHALGLVGEAAEFSELVKKFAFHGHPLDRVKATNELGDLMWYAARCAADLGVTLDDVVRANVAKLRARYPAGFTTAASLARVDAAPRDCPCCGHGRTDGCECVCGADCKP